MLPQSIANFLREYSAIFGNASYVLVFLSFLLRSILHLRVVSICASLSSLCFLTFMPAGPLWVPIRWNFLFIAVNSWQIIALMYQRRKQVWSAEEKFLSETALKTFPDYEVKNFLSKAERVEFAPEGVIIEKGIRLNCLYLLLNGGVKVLLEGKAVAELNPGEFLGEMSFLTNDLTRADVVAKEPVCTYRWSTESLQQWMKQDPARRSYLQTALGGQLVNQLMQKSVK